jgi:hypothetical protein
MQNFVQTVTAFVPVIQSAPMWVKAYFSLWLVATVGLGLSVIFTNGADGRASTDSPVNVAAEITPAPVTWPTTGDSAIDQTHTALNALNKQPNPTEGQLISGLRFIFFKPVFRHIYEEPPQRALFTFCRAQKLLEAYVSKFSSPDARRRLIDATQNLISLQDQFGALYGPAFSRDQQCELHGNALSDYVSTLPPRGQERLDGSQFDKAMQTLAALRGNLKTINLMD